MIYPALSIQEKWVFIWKGLLKRKPEINSCTLMLFSTPQQQSHKFWNWSCRILKRAFFTDLIFIDFQWRIFCFIWQLCLLPRGFSWAFWVFLRQLRQANGPSFPLYPFWNSKMVFWKIFWAKESKTFMIFSRENEYRGTIYLPQI